MTGVEIEVLLDSVRDPDTDVQLTAENRRKLIFELRVALDHYFISAEGVAQPWRFSIPKLKRGREQGKYTLAVEPNRAPSGAIRFWFDHLTNGRGNTIIVSQPYHFRDSIKSSGGISFSARTHSQMYEYEPAMRKEYQNMLGPVAPEDLLVAKRLVTFLQDWGVRHHRAIPLQTLTTADKLLGRENLIIVRSGDPYPAHTTGDGPFIRHVCIANDSDQRSDILEIEPFAWLRQTVDRIRVSTTELWQSIPVVVVRYEENGGRLVTLIEGPHTLGTSAVGFALTRDDYVDKLPGFLKFTPECRGFPKRLRMDFMVRPNEAARLAPTVVLWRCGPVELPKDSWQA
jgi:hypothetical protein